jgi:predicted Zn-dependent peptidase
MPMSGPGSPPQAAVSAIQDTDVRGVRVVSEPFAGFHSVALGVIFNLGSRDEDAKEQGLTHLVEHMLFKGTRTRTARDISRTIEAIGGFINGFTNKEMTGIFVRFLGEHFELVSRLVLDMVNESKFAPEELAKEQEVIFEEIKSGHEDPDDEVSDLLFQAAYGAHPLAFSVSGERETVGAITDSRLRSYFAGRYRRDRAVVVASGEVEHARLEAQLADRMNLTAGSTKSESRIANAGAGGQGSGTGDQGSGADPRPPNPDPRIRTPPEPQPPGIRIHERHEISQVFVCLAKPCIPYPDSRRHALGVVNAAFGGATSSRLFQRLREEEGLVYSVYSFSELFSDAGLFGVYLVTDRKKLGKALAAVKQEWNQLVRGNLEQEELTTARNFSKGTMMLSLENLSSRMMRMAHSRLLLDRVVPIEEKLARLDALTRDDTARVLESIGPLDDCYVSAVGPVTEAELKEML